MVIHREGGGGELTGVGAGFDRVKFTGGRGVTGGGGGGVGWGDSWRGGGN